MTPFQIMLVKQSFEKVRPIAAVAADLFYAKLFDLDPSLRALFKGDMRKQGAMLMSMIQSAVHGLDKPDALMPVVRSLGARHEGYGVKDSHYETVGAALIYTLESGLGEEFTADVRQAWLAVYGLLSRTMQEGAREAGAMRMAA